MNEDSWNYTPSWLSDLNVARTRMGINSTTFILIIAMVFVAVQIRQFNVIREDPLRPSFLEKEEWLKMERYIESLEKRLNETSDSIHSKTDEIEDKLESTVHRIELNSEHILKQQQNGE